MIGRTTSSKADEYTHIMLDLKLESSADSLATPPTSSNTGAAASVLLPPDIDLLSVTVQELSQYLSDGKITSVQLVLAFLGR